MTEMEFNAKYGCSNPEEFGRLQAQTDVRETLRRPSIARYVYEGNWYDLVNYGRELAVGECHLEGADIDKFATSFAYAYQEARNEAAALAA